MMYRNSFWSLRFKSLWLAALTASLAAAPPILADDVEIYLNPPIMEVTPNLLFVLDESGSMAWGAENDDTSCDDTDDCRVDQLKSAMTTILNSSSIEGMNAGLLGFSSDIVADIVRTACSTNEDGEDSCSSQTVSVNGDLEEDVREYVGMVRSDFVSVSDTTRAALLSTVGDLGTFSYTPTVRALRDAVAWYEQSFPDITGADYDSPIEYWCQLNHIVLLSDGQPNTNDPAHGGLDTYPDTTACATDAPEGENGRCAQEIASWANTTDLRTTGTDFAGSAWQGDQKVVTHTIGFHTNADAEIFLENIADEGGGTFYTADSVSDLVAAFEYILTDAGEVIPYTYTAPAIPMDASNAAVSGDYMYLPLFKPETKAFWKGNLKKYRFSIDSDSNLTLWDANGSSALDSNLRFVDTARSFWSTEADGPDPLAGGAASKLTGARSLYTYLETSTSKVLTETENVVSSDNTGITAAMLMLDAADATGRQEILDWIAAGHGEMGAPLHGKPKVVTYSEVNRLVLLATSDGMVHAINEATGAEEWAFIPDELLGSLKDIRANADNVGAPIYGLDGPSLVIHHDTDGDGLIDSGEHAYYIVGMRRGGSNYYALDISSRTAPEFAWEIIGGSTDFEKLGQTWSAPQVGRLNINAAGTISDPDPDTAKTVLFFGGGYDTDQDSVTGARTADDLGNAIYIVDVETGDRLKWISNSGTSPNIAAMTNAIPAGLTVIDVDTDGLSDRIYAADVGGRILRIDLGATSTGGVIADINSAHANNPGDTTIGNRRFFNAPEVAYVSKGGYRFFPILIGSGLRPKPEDTSVQDRFYMIKDEAVFDVPRDADNNIVYTTLTESNLYDATANQIQDGADEEERDTAAAALLGKDGWYIDMNKASGEKVFSRAVVSDYKVAFTTYRVDENSGGSGEDPCHVDGVTGQGRIYAISLLDATASFNLNGDGVTDVHDRSQDSNSRGISSDPQIVYQDEDGQPSGKGDLLDGLEGVVSWPDRFRALYWEELLQ